MHGSDSGKLFPSGAGPAGGFNGFRQVCRLINAEMLPAVLPLVADKLSHAREIVRKKAVLCIHRFTRQSPSSVVHLMEKIRRALCDQVRDGAFSLFLNRMCYGISWLSAYPVLGNV